MHPGQPPQPWLYSAACLQWCSTTLSLRAVCSSGPRREGKNHDTNNECQSSSASSDIMRIESPPFTAHIKQGALSLPAELICHNSLLWPLSCKSWHFSPTGCRSSDKKRESPAAQTCSCSVLCLSVFPLWSSFLGCSLCDCAFCRWIRDERGQSRWPSWDLSHGACSSCSLHR